MPIELRCSGCGGLLKLPDEHLGKQVRCGACGATLTATPSVPTLEESSLPSLEEQVDIPLRLRVVRDSTHHFRGNISARLTHEGLCLADGRNEFIIRPGACGAVLRRANLIGLEIGERHIESTVSKMGVYGDRLARDLVALLNGERGPLDVGDYRFEWYVWPLALLPLGILVLMRGGAYWGALAGGMIGLAFLVAHWERLAKPLRLGAMLGIGLASYAILAGILLVFDLWWPWALPVAEGKWQRLSPRAEPFSVELPGKPKEQPVDPTRQFLGFRPHMWNLRLGLQDLEFTASIAEGVEGHGDAEAQLKGARDDLLNSIPKARLIAEQKVLADGYPGLDIEIEASGKGILKGRLVAADDRLIALLVNSSRLSSYSADVDRFFRSLKVVRGAKRPQVVP